MIVVYNAEVNFNISSIHINQLLLWVCEIKAVCNYLHNPQNHIKKIIFVIMLLSSLRLT